MQQQVSDNGGAEGDTQPFVDGQAGKVRRSGNQKAGENGAVDDEVDLGSTEALPLCLHDLSP